MKILVADDDRTSRLVMRSILLKSGYEVVTAEDGAQAGDILLAPNPPRLVLLDWMMPHRNGPEVCKAIRSASISNGEATRPYTYVLLLTSRDTKEDLVEGLHAGADDYITKPCHPDELNARLRTGVRILQLEEQLIQARDEMHYRATHDALTRLANRGASVSALQHALQSAAANNESITVLLGDVDFFKSINDTYGHPAGDEVLREVARRIRSSVRSTSLTHSLSNAPDIVGRFGGEEFLCVLRHTGTNDGAERAEAIRAAIARAFMRTQSAALPVSISLGALTITPNSIHDVDEALRRTDELLYEAKRSGRNRVISGTALATASAGKNAFSAAPATNTQRPCRQSGITATANTRNSRTHEIRPSRVREAIRP